MSRRRLDQELVRRGLVESRTAAQHALDEGRVAVRGVAAPKAATLVRVDDPLRVLPPPDQYVSRGGAKLAAAIAAFGVPVEGRRALDVGASTGGFTDCLLQLGAAEVTTLDVGYGQLHWRLRSDPRVRVVDRTNARHADPAGIGAPFDLVAVDVSFISLTLLADQLAAFGSEATDYLLLVKPQFEVGKDAVGKGGVVVDPDLHRAAIEKVLSGLSKVGLGARQVVASPIPGAKGNREFFLGVRHGLSTVEEAALAEVVGA
ncbi:MAG: TlyA family RNA methyltransferase [Acidimicrobiia bacterium]